MCAARMTQFLYMLSCSFRLGVAAVGRNCARASCTSSCGDTRGLCAQQWFGLGDECTRLSFDRRGAVLWTDPPAPVWTSVANCRHLRASCSQTVRMGWCKASGKVVTLVSAPNCAVGSDRSVHCAVQGCASKCTRL